MGGGFSVGMALPQSFDGVIDVETEDVNARVVERMHDRRDEIAQKCLIFCCKMTKAIDKIQEY